MQHNAGAIHAAGHQVIGIDKEHESRRHDGASDKDVYPRKNSLTHISYIYAANIRKIFRTAHKHTAYFFSSRLAASQPMRAVLRTSPQR